MVLAQYFDFVTVVRDKRWSFVEWWSECPRGVIRHGSYRSVSEEWLSLTNNHWVKELDYGG